MHTDKDTINDIIIIGGGPAGLAAALYGAREGLDTLVVEKAVLGGMAAITDMIDNYPGFDEGISGMELAERLRKQAERFGAKIQSGVTVTGLSRDDVTGIITVAAEPANLKARAVLIATGSTYKHLEIPGEDELIGRGVHFCATCDGPMYKGRDLVVIGGGNSAIQEAIFLSRFASKIRVLVRGAALRASEVLQEEVAKVKNIEIVYNTSPTALKRDGAEIIIEIKDNETGAGAEIRTAGVFVFIGLLANTEPFATVADFDEFNFIKTGTDFVTRTPGIYAAGDVRSGSTWQIACAIGEGVSAMLSIRKYVDSINKNNP